MTPTEINEKIKAIRPEIRVDVSRLPNGKSINGMLVKKDFNAIDRLMHNSTTPAVVESQPETQPEINHQPSPTTHQNGKVTLEIISDQHIIYSGQEVIYHAKGRLSFDQTTLKVLLVIEDKFNQRKHRQRIDLYDSEHLLSICSELSDTESYDADHMETEMRTFTDLLEAHRDSLMTPHNIKPKREIVQTADMTEKAHVILKSPDLLDQIDELIQCAGVVGEEGSRLSLFVMVSTYKMKHPLHLLIQGASGSGKSHLLNTIADCFPQEDVLSLTRVTSKSFYHYGEGELVNKLLLIQDYDGLDDSAQFALREMQSAGKLTSSIPRKDRFGELRTVNKYVEAHFASMVATTHPEIYPDNMSRSVIIGIDESEDQTIEIMRYQNRLTAGLIDRQKSEEAKELLRSILRQIGSKTVINHYADQVLLPLHAKSIRRLNNQFQVLVTQVTLLHQFQRETDDKGRLVATAEDLRKAVELFTESIYLKVDELDPSTRQFFERLKAHIKTLPKGTTQRFTARDIRLALRESKTQVFRYLDTLKTLEYVAIVEGTANRGYKYAITWWDDADKIRAEIKQHLNEQINQIETPQVSDNSAYNAGVSSFKKNE